MPRINEIINTYTTNLGKMELPVIPTRNLSLSKGMNINIDVAREVSLYALEECIKDNSLVILLAQKDPQIENVTRSDLYDIGILAKVTNLIRLPYNAIKVSIKAMNRIKIDDFIQFSPYILATGEIISYDNDESDRENNAMANILRRKFLEYTRMSGNNEIEVSYLLSEINNADEIIDTILPNLKISNSMFQKIICETNTKRRYELIYNELDEKTGMMELEASIENQVKKKLEKMQREVYLREKIGIMQEELDENGSVSTANDYLKRLEALPIEDIHKDKIKKEIERFKSTPYGGGEAGVIQTYIETILDLPWEKESLPEINIGQAKKDLDSEHYGLKKVKERILEYLSVLKLTDSLKGPIICLVGPPGVGKTSIAKSIAKTSKRKFVRLSVGGTKDEAEIKGHRRTYIGSMPGRIIEGVKQVHSNTPVFLLDEIDKMSSDYRGDPASAMLEVLDPEQNSNFSDHYLEIPFDLSNVLFIATANSTNTIPKPLLDRMEVIEVDGYMPNEKYEIAKRHLLPKQLKQHGLKKENLTVSKEAMLEIISEYTVESGVRQLERYISKICRKAATEVVKSKNAVVRVTKRNIKDYLGMEILHFKPTTDASHIGRVTGLAYTSYGGDTLNIEVVNMKGKGNIELTGNLGDVMQESARAAFTYIRTIYDSLKLDEEFYKDTDIHIHVPEGATPKDGPSAGITLATAIISSLTKQAVKENIAMTGEITLSGDVLAIGGLREKLLAAGRAKIKKVLIPRDNVKDLEDIPEDIKRGIKIVPVKHMDEVVKEVFGVCK